MDYAEVKIRFTAYIKVVIENEFKDYLKKVRPLDKEISFEEFAGKKALLSVDDDSAFFMERNVIYASIEDFFTDKRHYRAMKNLSHREKTVLYMTVIEDMSAEQVAEALNMTKDNIWKIKSRATEHFMKNLSDEILQEQQGLQGK